MPSKTQQKCSICQEVGHNRRTCLQAAPHKSKKVKKVKRPVIDLTVDLTREAEPEEEQECCICMEKMQNVNCCTTRCGHKFCLTCFVRHSKGDIYAKCPLCRTTITDAPEPPPRYAPYDDLDDDELAQWISEATSSDDESDDEIAHDEIAHESSSDDTALDFLPTMDAFLAAMERAEGDGLTGDEAAFVAWEQAEEMLAGEGAADGLTDAAERSASFLRSLINPVATREEREHALQQVWHT